MIFDAKYFKDKLGLTEHPEGGYFREVYRSAEIIEKENLPGRFGSRRCFSTSIYFLLEGNRFSSFHKLNSDEIWHFYEGSSIKIFIIDEQGNLKIKFLGRNLENGEELQTVIPKQTWFAAEVADKDLFSLVGCTVAPGFEFSDFELGKREMLINRYPQHKELIDRFFI